MNHHSHGKAHAQYASYLSDAMSACTPKTSSNPQAEAALLTALTFSPHLSLSPNNSPSSVHEKSSLGGLLGAKLRKPTKMPVFGWDTTPVLGGESVVEEAFVDVWSDLIWGTWGGTTSGPYLGRGSMGEAEEERTLKRDLDRECNWVLVHAIFFLAYYSER